ncbi:MAG: acyl-CoA synthetase [Planctomycetes bacterium]|nr:acyl-CoA synthetase [Planctomycetota bacterium]
MRLIDERWGDWDSIRNHFAWRVPESFNIAGAVCDRHATDAARIALYYEDEQGQQARYTFRDLQRQANQLANALAGLGVGRGDRVGLILPQRPETAISHLAIYKLAAIAIPLANLFGPEALRYRLSDSGARVVITDGENLSKVREVREQLPALEHILLVGAPPDRDEISFAQAVEQASPHRTTADTRADDPAVIIYTSGTTGNPKGALHAHRYLLGHLPGFELSHHFFPQEGDLAWTPADWAWIGGLMDILMPAWFYGCPVLAYRGRKFDPEKALHLMEKYQVRNVFLPPTALKMIREVKNLSGRFRVNVRTIMSGGEALGEETLAWARETFRVSINEIYGQTEVNYVIGNCEKVLRVKPGSMGKPYPGHEVAVIDDDGNVLPPGKLGEIAFLRANDPVFFKAYWNNPEATSEKFKGDWACSGDLGVQDEEGYFWFKGRKDDVIISAGYRIGPTEIEESLLKHRAVALAAVVASPDPLRGSIVKAFIKLMEGFTPGPDLAREIQTFVKTRLAAHEYPREIEFVKELPMTTTGKIRRRDLRDREEERKKNG